MRVRVSQKNLRVEIENETRVLPESLSFENEMRVSQKSGTKQKSKVALGLSYQEK